MKTREELKAAGFKIDDTVYPNVAYRGKRFAPIAIIPVPTEREEFLQAELERLQEKIREKVRAQ